MKKKLLITALLAFMMLSAVACGKSDEQSSVQSSVTSESTEMSESSETSETPEMSETSETSETSVTSESNEMSESSETSETPEMSETSETSEEGEKEEIYYTVTFNSDGGSEVAPMSILAGEKVSKPTDPQKSSSSSEYEFLYWEYNGEEWDFEKNVVTENITLVAKWKKVASYTPPFLPKD
ncbi:MAG: InlB B-repeat-containing protein [Clostridia bacterium]|nr:InlB B-repeat-containing protein [Clostridia bacterium]